MKGNVRSAKALALLLFVVPMSVCVQARAEQQSDVLVSWDGHTLDTLDFQAEMGRIPQDKRADFLGDVRRITQMLENLMLNKTLATEARGAGLDKEPVTRREIEIAADRILAIKRRDQLRADAKLPDFETPAREYYLTHPEEFTSKGRVHSMHILVDTKTRSAEEALKLAQDVRAKLVAGENFNELAKKYSDDKSAQINGGDLGFFTRGRMVKEFEEAAFAMTTPGEISEPVQTKFGYHILRLVAIEPAGTRPFEAAKDDIVASLKNKYLNDRWQEKLAAIKNDKTIKLNEAAINALVVK